jgi:predicted nuclease of predicted toxin-antitoxin system
VSLQYYFDEHIPSTIAVGLCRLGVDVLSVQNDERDRSSDVEVLDRATELGRVTVTCDKDYLVEAALRQRTGVHFAGVTWLNDKRMSAGECIEQLEFLAKTSDSEEMAGRVIYLPLW